MGDTESMPFGISWASHGYCSLSWGWAGQQGTATGQTLHFKSDYEDDWTVSMSQETDCWQHWMHGHVYFPLLMT